MPWQLERSLSGHATDDEMGKFGEHGATRAEGRKRGHRVVT
jgi:hypothetical protein